MHLFELLLVWQKKSLQHLYKWTWVCHRKGELGLIVIKRWKNKTACQQPSKQHVLQKRLQSSWKKKMRYWAFYGGLEGLKKDGQYALFTFFWNNKTLSCFVEDFAELNKNGIDNIMDRFMLVPTLDNKKVCYWAFRESTSNAGLAVAVCISCAWEMMRNKGNQHNLLNTSHIPTLLASNEKHDMQNLWEGMLLVVEELKKEGDIVWGWNCNECFHAILKQKIPKYSLVNNVWIAGWLNKMFMISTRTILMLLYFATSTPISFTHQGECYPTLVVSSNHLCSPQQLPWNNPCQQTFLHHMTMQTICCQAWSVSSIFPFQSFHCSGINSTTGRNDLQATPQFYIFFSHLRSSFPIQIQSIQCLLNPSDPSDILEFSISIQIQVQNIATTPDWI